MNKTITFTGTLFVLMLALFQLRPVRLQAQTVLSVGDILFTGFNATPSSAVGDTFSFILLKDVVATTKISFTDRGTMSGAWQAVGGTESTITWTVGAPLTVGTEVILYGLTARSYNPGSGIFTTNGTVALTEGSSANGLSLANVGDQVIAFQGGNGSVTGSGVVFIAGIHFLQCNTNTTFAAWDAPGSCTLGPNSSAMPTGLSATGATASAFFTGRVNSTTDPAWARFNCPSQMPATTAALRSAIMTQSNWSLGVGPTSGPLPTGCNYASIALPIRLLSFEVSNEGNSNQLNWSSTKETTGDKFIIERSQDGVSFAYFAEVPARNTDVENAYQYVDAKPLSDVNYYRLLMVNIDGSREYSKVLSARLQHTEDANFRLYPNPFTNEISLEVLSDIGNQPKVKITDITGREVARYNMEQSSLNISLPQLSTGVYYIEYRDSKRSKVWKVLKQ